MDTCSLLCFLIFHAPQIQMCPPFNSESSTADDVSIAGFDVLGLDMVNKKKRRKSENVKKYIKSDCHMSGPMVSPPKLGSTLKGKLQTTNLVTKEVSTSTTTIREDTTIGTPVQTLQNKRWRKKGSTLQNEQWSS